MAVHVCCMSAELKAQIRVNSKIERELKRELTQRRILEKRRINFLLLGSCGCGKSTLLKQLRLIYGEGYSEIERRQLIPAIHRAVLRNMQALVTAMETLSIEYSMPALRESSKDLFQVNADTAVSISPPHFTLIQSLWADSGLQQCYERRREFQLSDSSKYLLDNLQRISADRYLPSTEDILRVREPSTGVKEYKFTYNTTEKKIDHRLLEVETCSTAHHQWLGCFENISIVLFVVSLSDYDTFTYREGQKVNSLLEQVEILKHIVKLSYQDLHCTLVAVVFNKMDEFEEKLKQSNLTTYFPDYTGPAGDSTLSREFLSQLFTKQECDGEPRPLPSFHTCALDREMIKGAWQKIYDSYRNAFQRQCLMGYELV